MSIPVDDKCPMSSLLFNIVLEVLVQQSDKKIKKKHPNRKEVKLSSYACNVVLSIENIKDSTQNH